VINVKRGFITHHLIMKIIKKYSTSLSPTSPKAVGGVLSVKHLFIPVKLRLNKSASSAMFVWNGRRFVQTAEVKVRWANAQMDANSLVKNAEEMKTLSELDLSLQGVTNDAR